MRSMSQNSEQIEAKLCAYLDGELDEQGRAEIEKHLEQNPAHRKLLSEVGKTRGLLRTLPRERAAARPAVKVAEQPVAKNLTDKLEKQLPEVPTTAPSAAHDLPVLARRVQGAWDAKERERLFKTEADSDAVAEATTAEGTRD